MEKIKLTVDKLPTGKVRYTKMHQGKRWKSTVYPLDSRRNRSEAWAEFQAWKTAQGEAAALPQKVQQANQELVSVLVSSPPTPNLETHQVVQSYFQAQAQALNVPPEDITAALRAILAQAEATKGEILPQSETACQKLAEGFTAHYRTKAESGQGSYGRYSEVRALLPKFVAWFGPHKSLTEADAKLLPSWWEYLCGQITSEGMNRTTANKLLTLAKTFVRWASETTEGVDVPANFASKRYKIDKAQTNPTPFSVEEAKLVLAHASERTRLYLLLCLNCGMYQGDISDLQAHEVDWTEGRIIRKRSKGKGTSNVKVNWLLWPTTFALLQKHANREGAALLNANGEELVRQGITANDNTTRADCITEAYRRVITKLKNRGQLPKQWNKSLSQLRKTGADLIESSPYAEFYELYLDHSTVAKRHYLRKDGKAVPKFDECLTWLGKQLGQYKAK